MKRFEIGRRDDWMSRLREIGVDALLDQDTEYWGEGIYYEFTEAQIMELDRATIELHEMCLKGAEHVIENNRFIELGIPHQAIPHIIRSWEDEARPLFGRFDLAYNGVTPPKMLEYNADTPLDYPFASVAQWQWLQDVYPGAQQANSIHENLLKALATYFPKGMDLYMTTEPDVLEEYMHCEYLASLMREVGLKPRYIALNDIGWSESEERFVDLEGNHIRALYKIYPWEEMAKDPFAKHIRDDVIRIFEPAWKVVMGSKGILPILWELYPDHPYLVPAYFETPRSMQSYVKKPLYSREGEGISLFEGGRLLGETPIDREHAGFVYQERIPLPEFEGRVPVIGSWVIGHESSGISIRETDGLITTRKARFISHRYV